MVVAAPIPALARRRSIGDRAWKGSMGGLPGSLKLVRSVPETRYVVAWLDDRVMIDDIWMMDDI